MAKVKNVDRKKFNSLPHNEQVKELKKMAKRANVRISLLEESGIKNEVLYDADDFNSGKGRIKNRFYEGTKYDSKKDLKETFSALSNFLNNRKSTLRGLNDEVKEKVHALIEKGQFDGNTLRRLTDKEKTYLAKESAKQANKRLKELEKSHIDKFAYNLAQQYNKATGRPKNRYYTGAKFKNDKDLNIHIQNIFHFLNSETSTARGYVDVIKRKLDVFRNKEDNKLDISDKEEQNFLDFLSSKQFDSLKGKADSNQVLETFVEARKKGVDLDRIMKQFEEFKNTNLSWDEVEELLGVAKWQKGGLLK
jgi:hypothetical protein